MLGGEKALLLAVRNRLREDGGYQPEACQIEYDEMAPAIAGVTYIVVIPGGFTPGPRHRTSGGVHDLVYSVDVTVVKRIGNVARDRMRDVFYANLEALSVETDKIIDLIDFDYKTMNAANALLTTANQAEAAQGFLEPLKFAGIERKPRLVPGELFAGTKDSRAAMARTVSFSSARRITYNVPTQ